jgi:hypothetical protein
VHVGQIKEPKFAIARAAVKLAIQFFPASPIHAELHVANALEHDRHPALQIADLKGFLKPLRLLTNQRGRSNAKCIRVCHPVLYAWRP